MIKKSILVLFASLLFITCKKEVREKKENKSNLLIDGYNVVSDVINTKGERKIELKNKSQPFKITIDSLKDKSVELTFYNENDSLLRKDVFKEGSFFTEYKQFKGKGKIELRIDSLGIYYKGWRQHPVNKNIYAYSDSYINSLNDPKSFQYVEYNGKEIIEDKSHYYQIMNITEDEITFNFSTIDESKENDSSILKTASYLSLIDFSSNPSDVDSIVIRDGVNTIKKSYIKNRLSMAYLETKNYYKNGKKESLVFIPFDTIYIPLPNPENF